MKIITFIFKALLSLKNSISERASQKMAYLLMRMKQVEPGSGFSSRGIPKVFIFHNGTLIIGKNFKLNNTAKSNPIGRNSRCVITVGNNAVLRIGDNVGMSGTAIIAFKEITISNNVKIGGNVCIYDTDFHALNAHKRAQRYTDIEHTNKKSVFIGKNAFIGAHATILKGVNIGENAIVGACSVVTKDIPPNEIWAGNPAEYIRKTDD